MARLLLEITLATVVLGFVGCAAYVLLRQLRGRLATACPLLSPNEPSQFAPSRVLPEAVRCAKVSQPNPETTRVSGLTYREAEDLLDWLQLHHYDERRVICESELFAVEFRVDAEHPQPALPHMARQSAEERSKAVSEPKQ